MARKKAAPLYEREREEAHDLGILDQRIKNPLEGSVKQVGRNLAKRKRKWEREAEDVRRRFRGEK